MCRCFFVCVCVGVFFLFFLCVCVCWCCRAVKGLTSRLGASQDFCWAILDVW